ncbi:hypothetical protein Ac2012v2_002519 [Leucoagaricus gongylophorus]
MRRNKRKMGVFNSQGYGLGRSGSSARRICMTQQPICLLGGPLIYVPILDNHFLSYFNPFCFSSMSSKRGRKRDDNLPFSQSREAQRDFRRRCRNHLEELQQRVEELEEENYWFRMTLGLPPSNRPPLGRGPTGRDKSKIYERSPVSSGQSSSTSIPNQELFSFNPSSHTINVSKSSVCAKPMHPTDAHSPWVNITSPEGHQSEYSPYPYLNNSLPTSSSRNSTSNTLSTSVHSHSSDGSLLHNYSGRNLRYPTLRGDPYTSSPFEPQHHGNLHGQSPSPAASLYPQIPHQPSQHHSPVSYAPAHRRDDLQNSHTLSELAPIQDHHSPPARYLGGARRSTPPHL